VAREPWRLASPRLPGPTVLIRPNQPDVQLITATQLDDLDVPEF
jgi:hypothetical protein